MISIFKRNYGIILELSEYSSLQSLLSHKAPLGIIGLKGQKTSNFKQAIWGNIYLIWDSPLCKFSSGRSVCPPSPWAGCPPPCSPRARCRWCRRTSPPRPPSCTRTEPSRPHSVKRERLECCCVWEEEQISDQ